MKSFYIIALSMLISTAAFAGYFKGEEGWIVETGTGVRQGYILGEYNKDIIDHGIIESTDRKSILEHDLNDTNDALNKWNERKDAFDAIYPPVVQEEVVSNEEIVNVETP